MSTAKKWAFSIDDGRTWEGSEDREQAIAEGMIHALDGGHATFKICPAVTHSLRGYGPTADEALDSAEDAYRENVWCEAEIDFDDEAKLALDVMLQHTWDAWTEICGITINGFTVDQAKVEIIDVTPAGAWEHEEPQP